jgi:hypothetical protein
LAAGLDRQPAARVAGGVPDAQLDAAQFVDDLLEPDEVDLDVVVDRDAERLDTVAASRSGPSL